MQDRREARNRVLKVSQSHQTQCEVHVALGIQLVEVCNNEFVFSPRWLGLCLRQRCAPTRLSRRIRRGLSRNQFGTRKQRETLVEKREGLVELALLKLFLCFQL